MYLIAFTDMLNSIKRWPFWLYMAWFEIKLTYRGSKLGPFWITISMAIFIFAMSMVYTRLFHQDLHQYLPFLLCGFLNWYLLSNVIITSTDLFVNASSFITQIRLPFFIYVFKHLSKNMIIYAHNFIVYVALLLIFQINPGWVILLAIPGLLLVLLNLTWLVIFLAMVSSRYRDLPPIINSMVQVAFFISPITWMPKLLGENSIIVIYNPITYLLEIVRDPLLGIVPPWYSWLIVLGMFIIGVIIIGPFFAKYRTRIVFWVL